MALTTGRQALPPVAQLAEPPAPPPPAAFTSPPAAAELEVGDAEGDAPLPAEEQDGSPVHGLRMEVGASAVGSVGC